MIEIICRMKCALGHDSYIKIAQTAHRSFDPFMDYLLKRRMRIQSKFILPKIRDVSA
jgi:hypothetical protein